MRKKTTIGIIGGGNMGAAIIAGVRKNFGVCVAEKDAARQRLLRSKYRIAATDLGSLLKRSDVVILAVKPQSFEEVLQEIRGQLQKRHLIVSIAAGITTAYIEKRLGKGARVVRTMPNLPAQIGLGMTALAGGKRSTRKDVALAKSIFDCIGVTRVVAEDKIDAVTAVSGSGPAYVFYFMECFLKGAEELGFTKAQAKELVFQTWRGSFKLLEESSDDAKTLREKVTSKGGTTEAALQVLAENAFQALIADALKMARDRAKNLSK